MSAMPVGPTVSQLALEAALNSAVAVSSPFNVIRTSYQVSPTIPTFCPENAVPWETNCRGVLVIVIRILKRNKPALRMIRQIEINPVGCWGKCRCPRLDRCESRHNIWKDRTRSYPNIIWP